MQNKLRNPVLFQGDLNNKDYFEGWYYKQVSADQKTSLSFIAAVSLNEQDAHSFIQYILVQVDAAGKSTTRTGYLRYSVEDFDYQDDPFAVRVGKSLFTESMIKYSSLPTCGLANEHSIIGELDIPMSFDHVEKSSAQILWFSEGYIEYDILNPLEPHQKIKLIEISFEASSEFPENNYIWPSDINFILNGVDIGSWTSPGNFADTRGILNPSWWPETYSQYGILKTIRISENETHLDGIKISNYKVSNINAKANKFTFRFSVNRKKSAPGGITLFGENFGNYPQNIMVKIYYV